MHQIKQDRQTRKIDGSYVLFSPNPIPETPEKQSYDPSVDLDRTVNPPHKRIRCEETDGAHQKTVDGASETCVREEEDRVCEAGDVELGGEVIARVGEDPKGRRAA